MSNPFQFRKEIQSSTISSSGYFIQAFSFGFGAAKSKAASTPSKQWILQVLITGSGLGVASGVVTVGVLSGVDGSESDYWQMFCINPSSTSLGQWHTLKSIKALQK